MDTVFFVIGIVVGLAAILAPIGLFAAKQNKAQAAGVFVLLSLSSALLLTSGLTYTLKAGEIGVEVNKGRIGDTQGPGGNQGAPFGLYGKAPWTDVEKLPAFPYTAEGHDIWVSNADGAYFGVRLVSRWRTTKELGADLFQNRRTSDEKKLTDDIINPLIDGVANRVAKDYANDTVYADDKNTVVSKEAIGSADTLLFAEKIKNQLAPRLADKGIILDDLTPAGAFTLSKELDATLAELSTRKGKTRIAAEDINTAKNEASAARERAAGSSDAAAKIPATLTPAQAYLLCVQTWAAEARRATEKGLVLYTNPCGSGGDNSLLVQPK